jgi:hypothetical protein
MLTMEDTAPIAEDLVSGFHELLQEQPEAVRDFLDAFKRREHFAGLPETRGITEGLEEVLAGLLSAVFTISHSRSRSHHIDIPNSFVQHFEKVLRRLAQDHPVALLLFKKHLIQRRCNSTEALAALLRAYASDSASYPY